MCGAAEFNETIALSPPNWPVQQCEVGTATATYNPWSPEYGSSGVGYENEDFIVWMRTAGMMLRAAIAVARVIPVVSLDCF